MNMTDGGTGGNTFSLLSDEKKKEALIKRSNSMKGKNKRPCSEEQKQKIREKLTGRKNPEHSLKLKGKKQSIETINQRSLSLIEYYKKNKPKTRKRVIQLDLDDNFIKIWNSITEAAQFYKISKGNISSVCNNKKTSSNGYKWKFELQT